MKTFAPNAPEIQRVHHNNQTSPHKCSNTRLRNTVDINLLSPRGSRDIRYRNGFDPITHPRSVHENIRNKFHRKFSELATTIRLYSTCAPTLGYETQLTSVSYLFGFKRYSRLNRVRQNRKFAGCDDLKNSQEILAHDRSYGTSHLMWSSTRLRNTVDISLLSLRVREIFAIEAGSKQEIDENHKKTFATKVTVNSRSSPQQSDFTAQVLQHSATKHS
jgi:hypothetical protein